MTKKLMKRSRALALACGVVPAIAAADTDVFTGASGVSAPYQWANAANWSNGTPGSTSQVELPESPSGFPVTLDLGGVFRAVDTLTFTNTSNGVAPYTLQNGGLQVNQITNSYYTQDPNVIDTLVTTTGSSLGIATLNGTLNITGAITAPNVAYTNFGGSGQAHLFLGNANNNISGVISLDSDQYQGVDAIAGTPGAFGTAFVQGNAGANISFTLVDPVTKYVNSLSVVNAVNVRIQPAMAGGEVGGTVTAGTLSFGDLNNYAFFESNGNTTLGFTHTILNGFSSFYSYTFDPGTRAYMDLGGVSEQVPGSSLSQYGFGTVTVSGSASYTGNTFCSNGMLVGAVADAFSVGTDINSGQVFAQSNGAIKYVVPQAALHRTFVDPYGALVGDFTGAIFSGANQNVFYSDGSILLPTAGPVPQRGVDVNHPTFLLGMDSSTFNVSVGEDVGQTSIYKGIAFGNYSPDGPFSGSVSETTAGEGFQVYVDRGFRDFSLVAFNTTNINTGVHFIGSGEARIGASHGTATVFTHTGAYNGDSSGNYVMSLADHSTLKTGEVVNISNGILFTGYPDSVDNGATVNIGNAGTYFIGAFDTIPDGSPVSGTFNIAAGGAVYIQDTTPSITAGAHFNFDPGSLLIFSNFSGVYNTGNPTWLPANADIVVRNNQSSTTFTGSGLVLGDGRRVTTPSSSSSIIQGGAGIFAQPGAVSVRMSAAENQFLRILDDVNLAGVDLVIGNHNVGSGGEDLKFTTVGFFADRQHVNQTGTIDLRGNVTTQDLTVYSGGLSITDATPLRNAALSVRDFNHFSSGASTLAPATINLSGSIHQTDGFIFLGAPVNYGMGSAITIDGGYINFQATQPSTLSDYRHQLTIGSAGTVYVDGPADPFSDSDGRRFDVYNDGSFYAYADTNVGSIDGAGFTAVVLTNTVTADHVNQNTLTIDGGGSMVIRPDGGDFSVSRVTNLSIGAGNQGHFDLTDNDLIVDYIPFGASPVSTIRSYLASGFNSGAWNGPGIDSATAHGDLASRTALGYAEASDLGLSVFDNQAIDNTTVLVKYTYYGDSDLNGVVNMLDFKRFLDGLASGGSTWAQGDYTYDGRVDLGNDFNLFLTNFILQGGSLGSLGEIIESDGNLSAAQKAQLLSVVPEPVGMGMIASMGLLAMRRRKTRSASVTAR